MLGVLPDGELVCDTCEVEVAEAAAPTPAEPPGLVEQVGEALVAVHVAVDENEETPLVDLMAPDLFERVTTAVAAYSSRAATPTPSEPLDVELERLARRLSDEFVAGDPEAGGLSSILQHAAREYRARLAPSTPTGEEEYERP
jgi:hypothetical protein